MEKKKVLLGMSGGVDSSAAAILLQEQGYEVIGCTMDLFDSNCKCIEMENNQEECRHGSLCPPAKDAKAVCDKLGIKHYVFDFKEEFKKRVINDFIEEYKEARTPNPCIQCNKYLKFGLMYEKARELGCEYISTGHYARTEYSEKYGRYVIRKATSDKKDQSYVLYNIPKNMISKVVFPLGTFESKEDIRKVVQKKELEIANKPDSQEICFIPDNNYTRFIQENYLEGVRGPFNKGAVSEADWGFLQGNIINLNGDIVGKHNGLIYYTIGQRKGLRNISSNAFVCYKVRQRKK